MWPEVWSSMSKCAQTTAKHQWEMDRTEIQAARQKKEIDDIFQAVRKARKKFDIPVEPAMPCFNQLRIPSAKAPTQRVAVSKEGEWRLPAFCEGKLSLTRRERELEAFESQGCVLHKARKDFIRCIILILHTRPCRSAKP